MNRRRTPHNLLTLHALEDRTVPAGQLDPSFGGTGIVTTPGGRDAQAVLTDGDVVVMSTNDSAPGPTLTRYLPDGSPDPTFNGTGQVNLNVPGFAEAGQIAALDDGSIVVAALGGIPNVTPYAYQVTLQRVAADGTVTATQSFPFASSLTSPDGPLASTDHYIVLLAANPATGDVYLVEQQQPVTPGDSNVPLTLVVRRLDEDFNLVGSSAPISLGEVPLYGPDGADAITVGPDGSVYMLANSVDKPVTLVKLSADLSSVQTGAYDPFPGSPFHATGLTVDATGKVIAVGNIGSTTDSTQEHEIGVMRIAPDLTPGAAAPVDLGGGNASAWAVTLDAAGRVIVAGQTTPSTDAADAPTEFGAADVAVARLDPTTLSLDPTFNGTGWQTFQTEAHAAEDRADGVAVDATGRIVVTGAGNSNSVVLTARLLGDPTGPPAAPSALPAGQAGTAYSATLMAAAPAASDTFVVTGGALPPGLTLAASGALSGTPTAAGSYNFTVTRVDPAGDQFGRIYTLVITPAVRPSPPASGTPVGPVAGTLDPTFGGTGVVTAGAGNSVASTPDGKLVIFGPAGSESSPTLVLTRLLPDGRPDPSFNGTGQVTVSYNGYGLHAGDVAVLADGSVVALVAPDDAPPYHFVVVLVSADGAAVTTHPLPQTGSRYLLPHMAVNRATGDIYLSSVELDPDQNKEVSRIVRLDRNLNLIGQSAPIDSPYPAPPPPSYAQPDVVVQTVPQDYLTGPAALTVAPDGSVYALGDDRNEPAVVKLAPDLTGVRTVPLLGPPSTFLFTSFQASGLAVDATGNVFIAGTAEEDVPSAGPGSISGIAVFRLDPTLTVVASTGVDFGGSGDVADAVTVDPAGRVVVVGSAAVSTPGGPAQEFAVARLNPTDLSLDPTFNGSGRATIGVTPQDPNDTANAVAIDPAGRIVVVGNTAAFRLFGGAAQPAGAIAPAGLATDRSLVAGQPYSETFTVTGLTGVYVFSVAGGTLPPGLTLSPAGALTGTPTTAGTYAFTVAATDPTGGQAVRGYTLTVSAPPPVVVPADVLAHFTDLGPAARVVTADLNGDGVPDYIGASGPGVPNRVQVLDGHTLAVLADFSPFEASFTGGVCVAAADLTGAGTVAVILTPDVGGGPVVAVYNGAALARGQVAEVARFYGIADPNFRGGVRAAVGTAGGVTALVVTAGPGGGPRVAVYDAGAVAAGSADPTRLVPDFYAFEPGFTGGVTVAAGDLGGSSDLAFGVGAGGGPRVRVVDLAALLATGGVASVDAAPAGVRVADFFAGDPTARPGVRVAVGAAGGGSLAALAVQPASGGPVSMYTAAALTAAAPAVDRTIDPLDGVFVG